MAAVKDVVPNEEISPVSQIDFAIFCVANLQLFPNLDVGEMILNAKTVLDYNPQQELLVSAAMNSALKMIADTIEGTFTSDEKLAIAESSFLIRVARALKS